MKRVFTLLICFLLLIPAIIPISASEMSNTVDRNTIVLDNGITLHNEVIITSTSRSTDKTATRRMTISQDGVTLGIIAFQATFRYDGSTVSVVSKAVTQTDTYEGWSYKQNSFTSSGGTVTLDAKLTKWLILNTSFTMTLTCDKNGNISYT